MNALISGVRRLFARAGRALRSLWRRFRSLRPRAQFGITALLIILFLILLFVSGNKPTQDAASYERTVTLASVASLSGSATSGNVIGTVRSVTEAKILAQAGGTVRRVNATIGSSVGAGAVLGELENASERAAVLQAEGAYDAAVAATSVTTVDVTTDIRNTYRSAFASLDTALEVQIDSLMGDSTSTQPGIVAIAGWETAQELNEQRRTIGYRMNDWRRTVDSAPTASPETLLTEMENLSNLLTPFVTELARVATRQDAGTTPGQVANLSAARETFSAFSAQVSGLRDDYRAQQTGGVGGNTSASEAAIKQALGSLRLAQANLEKTVIRAPIAGTINFFPIRVGDYVTSLMHVATVAQNGALEIVAYVSEDERTALAVGETVTVDDVHTGIITAIAPALDPVTKQIEVRVAVRTEGDAPALVNGQSVRISIPTIAAQAPTTGATLIMLPLSAVKLYADNRVVFTVNEEGRLVAQQVETGDVRGDRIEIRSGISTDLRIVTDARGLSEGEKVKISTGP